jgi:hypothetical protein
MAEIQERWRAPLDPSLDRMAERVQAAMAHGEFKTDRELADALNDLMGPGFISVATVYAVSSGRNAQSPYLPHIAKVCGVDSFWLATGRGEMVESRKESPQRELPQRHLNLLQRYRCLPRELRKPIRQLIEASFALVDSSKTRRSQALKRRGPKG